MPRKCWGSKTNGTWLVLLNSLSFSFENCFSFTWIIFCARQPIWERMGDEACPSAANEQLLGLIWPWGPGGEGGVFIAYPRHLGRRERGRKFCAIALVCPGRKEQSNQVKTVFQFPPLKNVMLSELMCCFFYLKIWGNSYPLQRSLMCFVSTKVDDLAFLNISKGAL